MMFAKPKLDGFKSPFFFFSNDQNSIIRFVSASIQEVLGYSPESLIGRKYQEFLDPRNQLNQHLPELQKRRFSGDTHHSSLCVVIDASGRKRVLKIQTYGEFNQAGQVIANHGIAQDVSAAYELGGNASRRLRELSTAESSLSEREKRILQMVITGRLNKSIAKELSISQRAVEMARARVMKKFNAETPAELVALAAELQTLRKVYLGQFLIAS